MPTNQKVHIKVGDTVKIISGFYKNKYGQVIKINRSNGKIILKGINFKFYHIRPKTKKEIGEIKQVEAFIHHSNVSLLNKNDDTI